MADPENPPGAAALPPRKTPAKKTPAKKAPAKKTTAKKTAVSKAPAKKAATKKAPAEKVTPGDATTRETAAKSEAVVQQAENPVSVPARPAGPNGNYAIPVSLGLAAAGLVALVLSRLRRE